MIGNIKVILKCYLKNKREKFANNSIFFLSFFKFILFNSRFSDLVYIIFNRLLRNKCCKIYLFIIKYNYI